MECLGVPREGIHACEKLVKQYLECTFDVSHLSNISGDQNIVTYPRSGDIQEL